jgi:murein DD-endopeptidase MepM/ murein hydrolase activator NlpD
MRTTFQSGLESLLSVGLILVGLGGLVAGGMYVWREPQNPVAAQLAARPQPLKSNLAAKPELHSVLQPQAPELPTAVVPSALEPTPVAPEPPAEQQPQLQPNPPEPAAPGLPSETEAIADTQDAAANADASALATATAQVQCQTPNTWFLPTGAIGKPRIVARFGKQAEGSPYAAALVKSKVVPTDTQAIFHPGLDFAVDANTPLFAVADGEVISTGYNDLYGKHLVMDTRDGEVLYAHLNDIFVKKGDSVTCSQPIGLSGATGKALTGAHLHLELRNNGKSVDPMPLIRRSLAADKPDWLR